MNNISNASYWYWESEKEIEFSLSTLSQNIISCVVKNVQDNNVVIVTSKKILGILPLISIEYIRANHKDVLCISEHINYNEYDHIENYCKIQKKTSNWCECRSFPPLFLNDDGEIELKLKLKKGYRGVDTIKHELYDKMKDPRFNKTIFTKNSIEKNILEGCNKSISMKKTRINIPINVGLCIIEDASSLFPNKYKLKSFIDKLNHYGIFCIIHTSNFFNISNIIDLSPSENIYYLPPKICTEFLLNDDNLIHVEKNPGILKYEIVDCTYDINFENKVSIKQVDGNGLEDSAVLNQLLSLKIDLPRNISKILYNILWILPRLFVHPTSLGNTVYIPNEERSMPYKEAITYFINNNEDIIKNNNIIFVDLCVDILHLCDMYDKTNHYFYHPYKQITKPCALLDYINQLNKDDSIIIAVYSKFERKILSIIIPMLFSGKFQIMNINNVAMVDDPSNWYLIMPYYITDYTLLTIYYMNFKKIIIFSYDNQEYSRAVSHLQAITSFNKYYSRFEIDTLKKYSNFIHNPEKKTKMIDRISILESQNEKPELDIHAKDADGIEGIIERLLKKTPSLYHESSIEKQFRGSEEIYDNTNVEEEEYIGCLLLKNTQTGELYNIKFTNNTLFMVFEDNELYEYNIEQLSLDSYVVLIEGEKNISLRKYIIQLYNLEQYINTDIIDSYKSKLNRFLIKNRFEYAALYSEYLSRGGTLQSMPFRRWNSSEIIGPQKIVDLKILCEMIEDDNLINSYPTLFGEMEELRKLNRQVGKEIKKIIIGMIKGNDVPSEISSFDLMDSVTFCKVLEIKKQ